jgi:sugar phosphate isomerase/epimerase
MSGATSSPAEDRFSLALGFLPPGDMETHLDIAAEAGLRYVAPSAAGARPTGAAKTAELLKARSLTVSSYHAGLRILEVSEAEADEVLREGLAMAAALGAPSMSVNGGTAGEMTAEEADALFVERLNRVVPLARDLGVLLGVEPIHPFLRENGFVHTVRDVAEIISRAPQTTIVLDMVHVSWDRGIYEDIRRHAERIGLVQLGNLSRAELAQKRWARSPLRDGSVPVTALVQALEASGYRGIYELENALPDTREACIQAIRSEKAWLEDILGAPADPAAP